MEKEFLKYAEALALKELGFNEPCFEVYLDKDIYKYHFSENRKTKNSDIGTPFCPQGNSCAKPTYQSAFRWFREKHDLNGYSNKPFDEIIWKWNIDEDISYDNYGSHEEAELACLRKLIEIVKQQK